MAWTDFCREIGDTKPSHLAPWDELSANDKEVDRRIAEAVIRGFLRVCFAAQPAWAFQTGEPPIAFGAWVPIAEGLPPRYQIVLVWDRDLGNPLVAYRDEAGVWVEFGGKRFPPEQAADLSHWAPYTAPTPRPALDPAEPRWRGQLPMPTEQPFGELEPGQLAATRAGDVYVVANGMPNERGRLAYELGTGNRVLLPADLPVVVLPLTGLIPTLLRRAE